MDWFLCDNGPRHERVNYYTSLFSLIVCLIGLILTEDGTTINNEDRKES